MLYIHQFVSLLNGIKHNDFKRPFEIILLKGKEMHDIKYTFYKKKQKMERDQNILLMVIIIKVVSSLRKQFKQ